MERSCARGMLHETGRTVHPQAGYGYLSLSRAGAATRTVLGEYVESEGPHSGLYEFFGVGGWHGRRCRGASSTGGNGRHHSPRRRHVRSAVWALRLFKHDQARLRLFAHARRAQPTSQSACVAPRNALKDTGLGWRGPILTGPSLHRWGTSPGRRARTNGKASYGANSCYQDCGLPWWERGWHSRL